MTPFARFLIYTAILVFLTAIFDDWPKPHPNSQLGYKAGLWSDYLAIMAFWMTVFELAYRAYRWTRKHKTPIVTADDQPDPQDHMENPTPSMTGGEMANSPRHAAYANERMVGPQPPQNTKAG